MYYGSDEFNNAIENTQGNALKTRLKFSDEEIIELVSSMRYYGGSNDTDDLSIGNIAMAYVEVSAFTNRMLTGREFLLESGVKLSDGTYEYAPIGYFTVQTPSGDYDEVTFTAYDRMIKFEKVYNSNLNYPTDSATLLDNICTFCGITLATPITEPITITENLKGYTCREILGYIAGIHGFFACIDRFGKLNLRWYSDTPIVKSLKTVWAFEKSQEQYEVEKVEVAKDSETSYTSGNGIITLHHSNPYATQEITDNLFIKLDGYAYMPAEIEMLDDIRLDPWDVISVTYYDGIAYLIPCMSIVHDFGATSTTIRAVGKTSTENEYRFTGPTIQYLNRMATDLLVANRVIATKVDAEYVNAHAITTENFDAKVAEIQKLVVEEIDGKYADIKLANIDIADVGTFFASSGILDDVLIKNGAVTGVLKGVRIVGDVIEANTIKADSLILSGSEESLIYQINVNSSGLTAEQLSNEVYKQKLSGTDLVAQSVTANELAANSVTSEKILAKSITAEKLSVASLSALSANLGTVTAGILQSANYVAGRTGVQLDLNNGVWNGKYFNIGSDGKMSATSGKIGNWEITTDGLRYEDGVFSVEISPPTAGNGNIALGFSTYDEGLESYVTEGYVGYNGRGYPYIYMYEYIGNFLDVQQIDATTVTTSFLDVKQDITVKGDNNILAQDYVCHTMNSGAGSTGYWRFARITVTKTYANAPIEFTIIQRTGKGTLQIILKGASTATAHTLNAAWQSGRLQQIYVVSVGSGVFDLYLTKLEAYDSASVTALQMSAYMRGSGSGVEITWYNEYVASVPSGAIKAQYVINEASTTATFKAVKTATGADLDTLETFKNYFEFTNQKKLSFLGAAYGGSGPHGFTIRWGSSSHNIFVDDTYWLSIDANGALRVGVQVNGATQPTWHTK